MPLYCCEDCKRAFTGFRRDAVQAHHDECPVCAGTLRLAFSPEEAPTDRAALGPTDRAALGPTDRAALGPRLGRVRGTQLPDADASSTTGDNAFGLFTRRKA